MVFRARIGRKMVEVVIVFVLASRNGPATVPPLVSGQAAGIAGATRFKKPWM